MVRYISIFSLLFILSACSQEKQKNVEGYYNLSGFETASGIYLLEDKTFFYYASFGNVDLKVFGEYSISEENMLNLHPDEELMKPFSVYGLGDDTQIDSIKVAYSKPYDEMATNLFLNSGDKWQRFPEFPQNTRTAVSTLRVSQTKTLKIRFTAPDSSNTNVENAYDIVVPDSINDIKIFHNYYAGMTAQISNVSFKVEENALIDTTKAEQPNIEKQELPEKIKGEVRETINALKNDKTIQRDGKTYQKLNVENAS